MQSKHRGRLRKLRRHSHMQQKKRLRRCGWPTRRSGERCRSKAKGIWLQLWLHPPPHPGSIQHLDSKEKPTPLGVMTGASVPRSSPRLQPALHIHISLAVMLWPTSVLTEISMGKKNQQKMLCQYKLTCNTCMIT